MYKISIPIPFQTNSMLPTLTTGSCLVTLALWLSANKNQSRVSIQSWQTSIEIIRIAHVPTFSHPVRTGRRRFSAIIPLGRGRGSSPWGCCLLVHRRNHLPSLPGSVALSWDVFRILPRRALGKKRVKPAG